MSKRTRLTLAGLLFTLLIVVAAAGGYMLGLSTGHAEGRATLDEFAARKNVVDLCASDMVLKTAIQHPGAFTPKELVIWQDRAYDNVLLVERIAVPHLNKSGENDLAPKAMEYARQARERLQKMNYKMPN